MLSKRQKIKRSEFQSLIHNKQAKIFHSPLFTARLTKNEREKNFSSKFSFVVSTKISKKATERNKLKRRGYAIIQKHKNKITSGCACVFFLKKESADVSFENLEKEVLSVLERARCI